MGRFCLIFLPEKFWLICSLFFESLLGGFGCHVWWFVDTFFVRARDLLDLQNALCWTWIYMFLHIKFNVFWWFHLKKNYLFWHWFLMSFGIAFAPRIGPFGTLTDSKIGLSFPRRHIGGVLEPTFFEDSLLVFVWSPVGALWLHLVLLAPFWQLWNPF